MLPDAATVARHPALAEFRLIELEERCATLEAALQRQFAEPMPPERITDTDVARVYRQVYGGPRFGSTEREFAEEIARLRDDQWKAALSAGHSAPQAAPVAGQCRFKGDKAWSNCSAEHVRMVLADPSYAADGYEVRYLYAAPLAPEALRAALAQQPQALEFSADAI